MSYVIEAVIARGELIGTVTRSCAQAHLVALPQGWALIPAAPEFLKELTRGYQDRHEAKLEGWRLLGPALEAWCCALSRNGAVGYVEAELFGGVGTQSGILWEQGRLVLSPFHAPHGINMVLRRLGVHAVDGDEFDTLNLGRYRCTAEWHLDPRPGAPPPS